MPDPGNLAVQSSEMYPKIQIQLCTSGCLCDLHRDGVWLGLLALAFTAIVVGLFIWSPGGQDRKATWLFWLKVTAAGWAVLPPLYFLAEWYFYNLSGPKNFEAFKFDQEKAKDLWAGVGAVLAALLLKKSDQAVRFPLIPVHKAGGPTIPVDAGFE